MARSKRAGEAGLIYHAMNRGNRLADLFYKPADCEVFLRLLGEGLEKYPLELFTFTLMRNPRHLVLRPAIDGVLARLLSQNRRFGELKNPKIYDSRTAWTISPRRSSFTPSKFFAYRPAP